MTKSNESKVEDAIATVCNIKTDDLASIEGTVKFIKSQQSHIELLESTIREFLDSKKAFFNRSGINVNSVRAIESRYHQAEETLRNLMENKS